MKGWKGNLYQTRADGRRAFPAGDHLVIKIHGEGDYVNTWFSAAEYLATQVYIVATASPFLEDQCSDWSVDLSDEEKRRIYRLRADEAFATLFSNFFGFLFGYDKPVRSAGDFPDPSQDRRKNQQGRAAVGTGDGPNCSSSASLTRPV